MSRKLQLSPDVAALNPGLARAVTVNETPYRSKLEERAVRDWLPGQAPRVWWYEPVTFSLPGGRYTPDLLIVTPEGTLAFVEVKGWSPSIRASRKAFLEAARTHRWASWCWLTWDKKEKRWDEEWV